jgi:hypothetical protein
VRGDDAAAAVLRGGELLVLGVASCGCFGSCAAGHILKIEAGGGVKGGGVDIYVGEVVLFRDLAGFCGGAVEERSALHDYGVRSWLGKG